MREKELKRKIKKYGRDILDSKGMKSGKHVPHHGRRSVYHHTMEVVKISLKMVEKLHLKVDEQALIRGALLHDYYLYDWHIPAPEHKWHGFTHPYAAYKNAKKEFPVTEHEKNIILRHMFPLTLIPPKTIEGWIICLADKIVSVKDYTVDQKKK